MNTLQEVFNNEYCLATLLVFAFVYAQMSAFDMPNWVQDLFKNDIFKIAFLSLIVMIPAHQAPHVAIIVAIIFVMTLNFLNEREMKENSVIAESFIGTLRHVNPYSKQHKIKLQNKLTK